MFSDGSRPCRACAAEETGRPLISSFPITPTAPVRFLAAESDYYYFIEYSRIFSHGNIQNGRATYFYRNIGKTYIRKFECLSRNRFNGIITVYIGDYALPDSGFWTVTPISGSLSAPFITLPVIRRGLCVAGVFPVGCFRLWMTILLLVTV